MLKFRVLMPYLETIERSWPALVAITSIEEAALIVCPVISNLERPFVERLSVSFGREQTFSVRANGHPR